MFFFKRTLYILVTNTAALYSTVLYLENARADGHGAATPCFSALSNVGQGIANPLGAVARAEYDRQPLSRKRRPGTVAQQILKTLIIPFLAHCQALQSTGVVLHHVDSIVLR